MSLNTLTKFSFSILFFLNAIAYAFDSSSLPSQQYSGSRISGGNQIPANSKPRVLEGVTIKENLGKNIDTNLTFIDEDGHSKSIGQILNNKPIILTLNYYRCSTLCSIQLVNLAKSMSELGWTIGKDFNMATISFDSTDNPNDSKRVRANYLNLTKQPHGQWSFYTGTQKNIDKLTNQIGFYYKYDPVSKEFAHAAAIFFISPNGKISRYLYGINYAPAQIKFSLMDASANKIGSPTDQILLTCFHYNPSTGKYDLFVISMLRIVAGLTICIVAGMFVYFYYRKKIKL